MKIYNGYERLPRNYTLMSDEYEFTMANSYLQNNKEEEEAAFDLFFRKIPNNGGYAIMAGLDKVISYIQNLKFGEKELEYFKRNGYSLDFVNYLRNFKFTGDIYAIPDGTPVFPNEPLITIKAPLIEVQIVETTILSMINGAMEHATGARKIIEATPKNVSVMEFGARRADGPEAAIDSSIYGIMAGCTGTSNMVAADMLNKKAMGTMAHSYIESFNCEYDAFLSYALNYPNNCILLVDTYDTLKSGVINAIRVFKYMRENNMSLDHIGIRIDSGDLAYLSKEARKMLDAAGFPQAKICLSNGLTAETIENLIIQGAKFDMLGVGDNISKPEGRMGCVYKEVALNINGELMPKIKLSNDTIKITNPGFKKVYRAYDNKTGYAIADIIELNPKLLNQKELLIIDPSNPNNKRVINDFTLVPLQKTIFKNGNLVYEENNLDIDDVAKYCHDQMETLYEEVKRTLMPHKYQVATTEEYLEYKDDVIEKERVKIKKI